MKQQEKKSQKKTAAKESKVIRTEVLSDSEMYLLEKSINEEVSPYELEIAESEWKSWLAVSQFRAG